MKQINPPTFLVFSTTIGFFALLALLFVRDLPDGTKDILQVMLGGVLGQWTTIISYFFGSSSGSAKKTDMMLGTGDGKTTTQATIKTESTTTTVPEPPKEGATNG
jgi:drug/metabolite transporter (DMT)-like permease